MMDLAKSKLLKLLVGIIYPLSNSEWASFVQCVPKKGCMMMVANEKNALTPTHNVIWENMYKLQKVK